jgi:hypothetical protein
MPQLAGAAFGAAKSLEQIVADRLAAEALAAQIAERQQRMQMDQERVQLDRDRFGESRRQADVDAGQRQQTIDISERSRRDRNNDRGMDLMRADKGDMDLDAAIGGLPAHLKPLGGLMKAGAVGKLSPEDLEPPEVKAQREAAAREQGIKDQIRVRNATREPRAPNYEKVLVDGRETFMTPEEVRARGGVDVASRKRASTGMERQALGFYNRMKDAIDTMEAVEDQVSERDLMLINNSPLPDLINNRLLSNAGQQYAQALQTYTEGRLRKESGAAIAANEYENDRKTIGRQANDRDDVRAQKKQTRRKTHEGIGYAAGPAYEEFYGEPFERLSAPPIQQPIPGVAGGLAESRDGGKTWTRIK